MSIKTQNSCSKEKINCPKCLILIQIGLNDLKVSNGFNIQQKTNVFCEFSKLYCQQCNFIFTFINCLFCNQKIYMKIYPKEVICNGLIGHNIKCPYKSCNKIFYFTKCKKCNIVQKQQKFIKEGEIITCINNKCNYQYIEINCPVKFCKDITYLEKPKIFTNYPSGIMTLHKNEFLFQKISCFYCCRPIVYKSIKSHKNEYIEAQKVECPYIDCKRSFNRIICPICSEENYINDGWYEMGSKIKCKKCKSHFGKIICPSCGKMNPFKDHFFKFGRLQCGFQKCSQINNMVNCLFCRKLNVFDTNIQIVGKKIKCGYCINIFNVIFCPFCENTNPFPLADFSFGKTYKCQYLPCMKEFQLLICAKCGEQKYVQEKTEGLKYKCQECNTLYMNWACPFCKENILDENTSLQMGQMIKCPSCSKIFSFIRCSGCNKLIFSKQNENLIGKSVKCPDHNCKSYTLITYCQECNTKIVYINRKSNLNEGEKVHCNNCEKFFIFQNNNSLYNGNLKILEQIQGKTIDFGVGEVDENYLSIQDLFFNTNNKNDSQSIIVHNNKDEYNNSNKNLSVECMVCHNNMKESVFVPCGHRCVCYNCAVIIFAVQKKCPKCHKEASCIIKKVYE